MTIIVMNIIIEIIMAILYWKSCIKSYVVHDLVIKSTITAVLHLVSQLNLSKSFIYLQTSRLLDFLFMT